MAERRKIMTDKDYAIVNSAVNKFLSEDELDLITEVAEKECVLSWGAECFYPEGFPPDVKKFLREQAIKLVPGSRDAIMHRDRIFFQILEGNSSDYRQ